MKSFTFKKSRFTEVEVNIKIKDELIPKDIQDFLLENRSRHITLVEKDGFLWVASKLKAKKINLREYKQFEICYMTPAKGGGFVAIQAWPLEKGRACTSIVEFGTFSEQALESANEFANLLEPILGYQLNQDYWGADC